MSDDVTHIGVLFNEAFEAILSKALTEEQKQNMQTILNLDAVLHAVDRSHFVRTSTVKIFMGGNTSYQNVLFPFIYHFFLLDQAFDVIIHI